MLASDGGKMIGNSLDIEKMGWDSHARAVHQISMVRQPSRGWRGIGRLRWSRKVPRRTGWQTAIRPRRRDRECAVHLHVAWRPLEQAIAAVCFLAGLGFGSAEAVSTGWPDATAGSYLLTTASAVVHSTGRVQRRGLAWASGTGAVASPVAVD